MASRLAQINELLEIASDYEAADAPEVAIYEEPQDLDEDLLDRIQDAVWKSRALRRDYRRPSASATPWRT